MDSSNGHAPPSTTATQDVLHVQRILSLLTDQLLDGCGQARCTNVLCDTGRRNTSVRPARRYTVLSARSIALSICSSPDPESRICSYYAAAFPSLSQRSRQGQVLDHSSWAQLTAATRIIEQATSTETPLELPRDENASTLDSLNRQLDELDGSDPSDVTPGHTIQSSQKFMDVISAALDFVLVSCPNQKFEAWKHVSRYCVSDSSGYPLHENVPLGNDLERDVIDVQDILHNESLLDLLERAINVYSQRCIFQDTFERTSARHVESVSPAGRDGSAVQDSSPSSNASRGRTAGPGRRFQSNRHFLLRRNVPSSPPRSTSPYEIDRSSIFVLFETNLWERPAPHIFVLHVWLKVLFLRRWDGNPVLTRFGLCAQCLLHAQFLIEAIQFKREGPEYAHEHDPMAYVAKKVDKITMVRSWLYLEHNQRRGNDTTLYHILDFHGLFKPLERLTYFRTANFLQMRCGFPTNVLKPADNLCVIANHL